MSKREKQALMIYNHILNNVIEPLTGNTSTYMDELKKVGRGMLPTTFKGVYASDKIPVLNNIKKYCILNLDKTGMPGSHWIALARGDKHCLVYDSFGRDHAKIIPDLKFSGNGRIHNTDRDVEQKKTELNCGARCLAWLIVYDRWGEEIAKLI
jgi:hypothetical protein